MFATKNGGIVLERLARIKSIDNFRFFSAYRWNNSLKPFGRFNLIYGWNGCVKSTFSDFFASLSQRETSQQNVISNFVFKKTTRLKAFILQKQSRLSPTASKCIIKDMHRDLFLIPATLSIYRLLGMTLEKLYCKLSV